MGQVLPQYVARRKLFALLERNLIEIEPELVRYADGWTDAKVAKVMTDAYPDEGYTPGMVAGYRGRAWGNFHKPKPLTPEQKEIASLRETLAKINERLAVLEPDKAEPMACPAEEAEAVPVVDSLGFRNSSNSQY